MTALEGDDAWRAISSPDFDEFSLLEDYARFNQIEWRGRPAVRRQFVEVGPGQRVSAIVWGDGNPELVLLHGGGQNAHTWDVLLLLLGCPAVAIDLPGHGHSDWREDRDYAPRTHAHAVAATMDALAPKPHGVIGMSLGGLTTIPLMATRPDLVRQAVIIDVSPGVMNRVYEMTPEERGASGLTSGPSEFDTFQDMVEVVGKATGRTPDRAWRGARLNAKPLPDGRWTWSYDRRDPLSGHATRSDFSNLWDDVSASKVPLMVVPATIFSHIPDGELDEYRRRRPDIRIEPVESAGHSVQNDQPRALAELIKSFISTPLSASNPS